MQRETKGAVKRGNQGLIEAEEAGGRALNRLHEYLTIDIY